MDDEDFYIDHPSAHMFFEAMMYAGGFMRQEKINGRRMSSPDLSPPRRRSISPKIRKGEFEMLLNERYGGKQKIYADIAEKNAQELIKEEEQAKNKAERRKAKKERQKQKKNEKNTLENFDKAINLISNDYENMDLNQDSKEAEGLDLHAAFMSKAVKKVKNVSINSEEKFKKNIKDIDYMVNSALECQNNQQFEGAVQYLSDAINLDPKRIGLILKRSFLYYQLAKFEKSIRDAHKVLEYSPNNADGYYRLGEGHFALHNLSEAESAFTKLISLNAYYEEAQKRLFSIRIKQLEEMGYHPNEAFTALLKSKNKTLDEAIEYLTSLEKGEENTEDIYYSDEDESEDESEEEDESEGASTTASATSVVKPVVVGKSSALLTDPSNPVGCRSLFVGNLKSRITYNELHTVFIKFGEVDSINLTTQPTCYAFVNYAESETAGRAMGALQGSRWLISTVPLIIKYPTNVVNKLISSMKPQEVIAINLKAASASNCAPFKPVSANYFQAIAKTPITNSQAQDRPRLGPKEVKECKYWRSTGCVYGNKCFHLHVPEHQGIARKQFLHQF